MADAPALRGGTRPGGRWPGPRLVSCAPAALSVLMALPSAAAPAAEAPALPSVDGRAAAPDPVADGWASEAFSEAASAALSRLAKHLTKGGSGAAAAGDDAAFTETRVAGAPLRPEAIETIRDDRLLRVSRWQSAGQGPGKEKSSAGRTDAFRPLAADLAEVLARFGAPQGDGSPALQFAKFKLFAVDFADPAAPVTRQYVTLAGDGADGRVEQNATWRIVWNWSANGKTDPKAAEIGIEAFEEVLVKRLEEGAPKPVFSDATQSVIGGTSAFRDQLRFGNTHWRQRIEVFNRFFKFGHHGIAVGDANGDGRDDLYVCQNGGLPNRLFLQNADGTAREVAAEAGVDFLDLTRAALFVDLDNDGDQDLVLAADTGLLACRNDGTGKFEPMLRYPHVTNAFSLTAADHDDDGDLDLYVCRYFARREEGADLAVPVPYFAANNGGGNYLIRNDGPAPGPGDHWLAFSDATEESGLEAQNNRRFSFAAVWEDLDNDGDQDLFVANDFGLKNLYVNDGGRFTDVALAAGVDDGGFGMSAAAGDYDEDGTPDLYAGNMFSAAGSRVTRQPGFRPGLDPEILQRFQRMARGNSLFRGIPQAPGGAPRYDDVSMDAGVTVGRWSWGSIFADLDNDGWEDLYVANGFVTGSVPDDL